MPFNRPRLILPALLLATSLPALAVPPKYHVETQLEGLAVNYDVQNSEILTTINASNHGNRSIICDAQALIDGQDKLKSSEQSLAPGKIAAFSFRHSKITKKITLYLMCTAKGGTESAPAPAPAKRVEVSPHITIEEL